MTPNKYQIHLDPKLRCAFVRHDGQISLSDVPNSLMEILRHPDYSEGMNILRDARAARLPKEYGYHFFVKESPKRLGQIEEELGKCSLAWVLGGPTDFAVTHQFILSRRLSNDKIERRPFRSLDAAMEWLEIPPRFRIPIFNG